MLFRADFHIHSHYSLATSKQLSPEYLDYWGRIKGLKVIGTGDFSHPAWTKELKQKITPREEGLFALKKNFTVPTEIPCLDKSDKAIRFILSAEISTIYKKNEKVRKVHNVILSPSFKIAEKIQKELQKNNFNITSDGRPILGMDCKDLLDLCLNISQDIFFIPAHIWTPWFSTLGSKSGFDTIEECFEDLTPYIYAVETGLSTDAPMNWMCPFLDKYTLLSNSDAHSPEKLGRNANLFNCELSYPAIIEAIKTANPKTFLGTIDLFPQEGKYHYDGHRKCEICWNPLETLKHNNRCSVCGKPVTVGVMNRIAALSTRKDINKRPNKCPFDHIIPLKEILSEIHSVGPNSKKITKEYFSIITKFGTELDLLLTLPIPAIIKENHPTLAEAIKRMRAKSIHIKEGYDGEFGQITVFNENEKALLKEGKQIKNRQTNLTPHPLINFDLKEYQDILNG